MSDKKLQSNGIVVVSDEKHRRDGVVARAFASQSVDLEFIP